MLHRFAGGSDGVEPYNAGVIDLNGTLYGTTEYGGSYCGQTGCGTVFALAQSGAEHVLHSFTGGSRRRRAM
jgi:uncharacterized repeat protein (TIGR03803 family)